MCGSAWLVKINCCAVQCYFSAQLGKTKGTNTRLFVSSYREVRGSGLKIYAFVTPVLPVCNEEQMLFRDCDFRNCAQHHFMK
jgi:hypothetical protein